MFVPFRFLRERAKRKKGHESDDLTLANSHLTPGQLATAQKALRILGLEHKLDELTKEDFVVFLYAMGLNPTDDIIDSKLRTFKLHQKKTFTFGQLAHVWHSMLQDLTDEDEILKRAFQFFDKDGNGEISVQELRTTMHELGDLLTDDEITSFMKIMDVNNDGAIGYNEFLATLKTQGPDPANGGSKGPQEPGEEQAAPRTPQEAPAAAALSVAASVPGAAYESHPLNSPTSTVGGRPALPVAAGPEEAAPKVAAPLTTSVASAMGSGDGGRQPDPLAQTRGSATVQPGSSSSSLQLPAFAARRQLSLKAGLMPPLPVAPAEPLLPADAAAAAPPPPLPRPSSSRLGQSLSMTRTASGPGSSQPAPPLERAGSQKRADDSPSPETGAGTGTSGDPANNLDPGQRLRSPSALELGAGS